MRHFHPYKIGLALGLLSGASHFLWAILVAVGWAQSVIDFVFWMHFIKPIYIIGPFDAATAAVLVAVTFAIGFLLGFAFATVWNWMQREAAGESPVRSGRLATGAAGAYKTRT